MGAWRLCSRRKSSRNKYNEFMVVTGSSGLPVGRMPEDISVVMMMMMMMMMMMYFNGFLTCVAAGSLVLESLKPIFTIFTFKPMIPSGVYLIFEGAGNPQAAQRLEHPKETRRRQDDPHL